ncbi:MAG: aromatic amino acid transaminase [Pseudomonadota bacterium]
MAISTLEPRPADPLLSIIGAFKADPSPDKIDLGVGIYQDEHGKTPIMRAIAKAHQRFTEVEDSKAYMGPLGWPGLADAGRSLLLGDALEEKIGDRIRVVPTPGGCGALRLAGETLKRANPNMTLWISDPTWANHVPTFTAAGLTMKSYPYYQRGGNAVESDAMHTALEAAQPGDAVLLHGCCHNPAGEDLATEDWAFIAGLSRRNIVPLIDIAYHGLGDGLDPDLVGVRRVLAAAPEALVCYSFSKNMGLYRDRVGFLAMLGADAEAAQAIQTHVLDCARRNYSMPPTYGEALAFFTLTDDSLRAEWQEELDAMRERVQKLRNAAADALARRFGDDRFGYIRHQKGMFSLLLLSPEQVAALRERHSIYTAPDGRINICGLSVEHADHIANCIADVVGEG